MNQLAFLAIGEGELVKTNKKGLSGFLLSADGGEGATLSHVQNELL